MKHVELKVIRFNENDVIATSGPLFTFSGFYDNKAQNGTINGLGKKAIGNQMIEAGLISAETNFNIVKAQSGNESIAMNTLFNFKGGGDNGQEAYTTDGLTKYSDLFNGTFTWDGTKFIKQ